MWRFALILLTAFFAVELGAAENIDKVNGSIRIGGARVVGDLSTVNGSIEVGVGTRAEGIETVNGSIQLQPRVVADSVATVNGSVKLGMDAQVVESAETVNGRISLDKRAQVGGHVGTVNGDLLLEEARVDGQLRTVNGDITVGSSSRVGGGILVEEARGWKFNAKQRVPTIVVGPGAVVDGTLRFEREVKLYVSDTATIGKVEGATPIRFDGDHPE